MSKTLADIRVKIDSLDSKIQQALMERASLIKDIIAEKKKHSLQFIQPAREAQTIRRLLEQHTGVLPEKLIVNLWRELIGTTSLLQTGFKVYVADQGNRDIWDSAKNYFGGIVEMQALESASNVLSAVNRDEATFGVLPWPEEAETKAWWPQLLHGENTIKIVCALPFGVYTSKNGEQNYTPSLVVSKANYDASGDDNSFIALRSNDAISKTKIINCLKELDITISSIISSEAPQGSVHLVEINTYLTQDAEGFDKFSDAIASLGDVEIYSLGGYPVPPEFKLLPDYPLKP